MALAFISGIVAWGLSQRLRPAPMPPMLSCLLESRIVAAVVGPEVLLDRAGVGEGMRVLDAGCGPGRITLPLARRVGPSGRVVAVDAQQPMLDKLESRLGSSGLMNVSLVKAELGTDTSGTLTEGETFDRVILTMVMGEIRERRKAFETLYEATAPGGVISVTETLEPDYRRKRVVRREIEAAGFQFERVYAGLISYTMNFEKPGG